MEKCAAIIVRLTRLTETSLIVHWLTDTHGLIKTIARGARRPNSKFAGKLDLFFGAEVEWSRARQGELHALREVSVTDYRSGLRESYAAMLTAGYFCHLLEWAVEREHPEPEMYDLLGRALDYLAANQATRRALDRFEYRLAVLLGVAAADRGSAAQALQAAYGQLPAIRAACLANLPGS